MWNVEWQGKTVYTSREMHSEMLGGWYTCYTEVERLSWWNMLVKSVSAKIIADQK